MQFWLLPQRWELLQLVNECPWAIFAHFHFYLGTCLSLLIHIKKLEVASLVLYLQNYLHHHHLYLLRKWQQAMDHQQLLSNYFFFSGIPFEIANTTSDSIYSTHSHLENLKSHISDVGHLCTKTTSHYYFHRVNNYWINPKLQGCSDRCSSIPFFPMKF